MPTTVVLGGFLPLEPMPAPRPRFTVRGKFPVAYTPADYRTWKEKAAALIKDAAEPAVPFEGPVKLDVTFFVTKPKTSKLDNPKPDVDNYLKSLMDAINDAGVVWLDDTQVVEVTACKMFASTGAKSGIRYNIKAL